MRLIVTAVAFYLLSIQAWAMVGGEAAPVADPTTKSVVFIAFGESNRCTGAVIAKRLVLSAAHCMEYPPEAYQIVFTADLTPILQQKVKAQFRRVVNVYKPPTLGAVDPLSDDAVILELNADIPDGVQIAAVADHELNLPAGTSIVSYGFGLQNKEGIPFPMLPSGDRMPWEPVSLMRKAFATSAPEKPEFKGIQLNYHRLFIEQSAGGICLGDSGGPVFLKRDGQQDLLVAVNGADVPDFPKAKPDENAPDLPTCAANAYVTRIDTLAAWIQSVIAQVQTPAAI